MWNFYMNHAVMCYLLNWKREMKSKNHFFKRIFNLQNFFEGASYQNYIVYLQTTFIPEFQQRPSFPAASVISSCISSVKQAVAFSENPIWNLQHVEEEASPEGTRLSLSGESSSSKIRIRWSHNRTATLV